MILPSFRSPLLDDNDIYFIITTVANQRSDHEHLYQLLCDKPDLLEIMLNDEKIFQRVLNDPEIFLKISSYLFFSIIMRRVYQELQEASYTFEVLESKERVPVFDAQRLKKIFENRETQEYLILLLNSFVKTESTVVYFREGTRTYRRRYSDLDLGDLQELTGLVEERYRFPLYRRTADLALFLSGIFPEYVSGQAALPKEIAKFSQETTYTLRECEEIGRKFYRLAATHEIAAALELDRVLHTLANNFSLIRKPLNYFSQKYGHLCRAHWSDFLLRNSS